MWVWALLMLAIAIICFIKSKEVVTEEDNNAIMDSIKHRENSFLMKRTESKWGKE